MQDFNIFIGHSIINIRLSNNFGEIHLGVYKKYELERRIEKV